MKTIVNEILNNLEENKYLSKQPFLGVSSMFSNMDISNYLLPNVDRNKNIYAFNISRDNDIVIGEKYMVIFSREDPKSYQKTDCEINFVSLKKNDNIGVIPRGYGGIIRLNFKDKVPEITKLLRQNDSEQFDNNKHQYLFFTTQEVMDRILEELDKQENPIV